MPGIIAVMSDIFFAAKIIDAAKPRGLTVTVVHDPARIEERIRSGPVTEIGAVIVDLNCSAASPLDVIARIKSDPATCVIPVFAFVSHIQTDLRRRAAQLGCDEVLPRSVFSETLPQLLDRVTAVPPQTPAAR